MSDWTDGYRADIDYTFGYYPELNPLRLKLALLNRGLVLPDIANACELGFGQGLSVNIHAAASGVQWHGTDFNPSQASLAQELAVASGSGARLFDDAFAEFAARRDLPEFDYIGLHGIWSWISDENQAVLVDFIKHKLKLGGVLYISYNTLPGWANFAPMRHLFTEHARFMSSPGDGIGRGVSNALKFATDLLDRNPAFSKVNPTVGERLRALSGYTEHYVAHEYFNQDWTPVYFAKMAASLSRAKLDFAGSASYLDYVDAVNLTGEQQSFLKGIPDDLFRQSVRDFMVNQQFRKDYWIKGARKLGVLEQIEAVRRQKVLLTSQRDTIALKVNGALGEATLTDAIYTPILDLLADHKPRTIGQMEQALTGKSLAFAQILQAVMVLSGAGHLAAVQDDAVIAKARKHTDKLNAHLMNRARGSNDIGYLASPVTGGGVVVGRFQQLFLLALNQGKKQPADWAAYAWDILARQGQRLLKDGKAMEAPQDNLQELSAQAQDFAEKQLSILKALQVA